MDLIDNLDDVNSFGYSINQKITVDEVTLDKIVIKSPVIEDDLGNKITKYVVMFSQYPLSQIFDNTSLLDQSKEKTFEFTTVNTEVTMELKATEDGIISTNIYYLFVIPKDNNGVFGGMSNNEIRFKLATQKYGEGTPDSALTAHTAP